MVELYLNTWCNPTRWQRFLSTESEMLRRRILVNERGRFPFSLVENCRKINSGKSCIVRDFWSSSRSRNRTVVLRSIFTPKGEKELHLWKSIPDLSFPELIASRQFRFLHLRWNLCKQALKSYSKIIENKISYRALFVI